MYVCSVDFQCDDYIFICCTHPTFPYEIQVGTLRLHSISDKLGPSMSFNCAINNVLHARVKDKEKIYQAIYDCLTGLNLDSLYIRLNHCLEGHAHMNDFRHWCGMHSTTLYEDHTGAIFFKLY